MTRADLSIRINKNPGEMPSLAKPKTAAIVITVAIVELTREHGRVTMSEVIQLTGASRNTLKQYFRALLERGTLNQHDSGRIVWYDLR
ncbi:DUF977 family protein [Litoricolaceae bacterium]|nr:DUF977 family protein [Litorivicinaceae bacterium]